MSQQWFQTVAAQEEWLAEQEAREIERANELLAEMKARDEEFRQEIEAKYPILKGWK